jgi:chloramphenicol O-acetyltransferase type B
MVGLLQKIRYKFARLLGAKPCAIRDSKINSTAVVGGGAQFVNSSIGRYSYVFGSRVINSDIGSFCSIAADCTIGGGGHPTDWVSSSPLFYRGHNILSQNFSDNIFEEYKKTKIGNDVWIGSKCLIKGGVTIGDGAIIGMGSVVTHDVPPYEIWAGNPARLIRRRFDEDTIQQLIDLHWWDLDNAKLKECGNLFNNPIELIAYLKEKNR